MNFMECYPAGREEIEGKVSSVRRRADHQVPICTQFFLIVYKWLKKVK